jgi:hypothetical protein
MRVRSLERGQSVPHPIEKGYRAKGTRKRAEGRRFINVRKWYVLA